MQWLLDLIKLHALSLLLIAISIFIIVIDCYFDCNIYCCFFSHEISISVSKCKKTWIYYS